jgi:hypothetical protein
MDSFNSFNISFIPRDKNQNVNSMRVVASLFNPNDSQNQNTFCVKRIFRPSIPDNQDYLQVFENYEHVADFFTNSSDSSQSLDDQNIVPFSKDCVSVESLFTRDDQTKIPDLKEEAYVRKVQETQKINIGTHDSSKYVNLGIDYTREEMDQYTYLFKEFRDIFSWTYDDLKEYDKSIF